MERNIVFSSRSDSKDKLGFLYRRCSCHPDSMRYWLSVPEFRMEIESIMNEVLISDEVVLPIMQTIYDQKINERRELRQRGIQSDFSFGLAKSGIRSIRKSINHQ